MKPNMESKKIFYRRTSCSHVLKTRNSTELYRDVGCPLCNKTVFRVTQGTTGEIKMKCPRCNYQIRIPLVA